jgi:hypothetical protein
MAGGAFRRKGFSVCPSASQTVQQLLVNAAKTAIAHHQDMIAAARSARMAAISASS